jgi:hypothetical protein
MPCLSLAAHPGSRLNAPVLDADLRRRFAHGGLVRAVRTIPLVEHTVPTRLVLAGATAAIGSRVVLVSRMVVVRFDGLEGRPSTLVWEPRLVDGLAATVLESGMRGRGILSVGRPSAPRELCSIAAALERCGVEPGEVDLVAVGDLRGHDLRRLTGTLHAPDEENQPRAPLFGAARVLVQARELAAARSPHPLDVPWYVPRGASDLVAERLLELDGDVELGQGVMVISTPGLSAGHQSLLLNTRAGVWVVSGNGVALDCWQPLLSKIPGVRRGADTERREAIVPSAGVHDPLALYDSLLRERALADASRADPRWLTILPDRELARRWRQWPAIPTFSHDGLSVGRM